MSTPWLEPDMGRRFADANWRPIELDGQTVHPMLRLAVHPGDAVLVEWLSTASPRVQGVALWLRKRDVRGAKGRGGILRFEASEAPSIALWTDLTPAPDPIHVVKVSQDAELQISNRWRTPEGRVDEWFQNYGMLIDEERGNRYVLHCSDGMHPPGPVFSDLVVQIRLERGALT